MRSERRSRRSGSAGLLALALLLAGCSDHGRPPLATTPAPQPGFTADSPVNAVRLLEWSWDHRDLDRLRGLFTDDYLFLCAASDSAGNAFQGRALTRLDELESAHHVFVGGGVAPPATGIALQFDRNLIAQPDGRAGKQDESLYQEIATSLVLRIITDDNEFQVSGAARFFLVRGDVALIPAELAAQGARPDPGRWYIERWEDETSRAGFAPARAREPLLGTEPAKSTTFCSVKTLYR
jgi:hypothetical protein